MRNLTLILILLCGVAAIPGAADAACTCEAMQIRRQGYSWLYCLPPGNDPDLDLTGCVVGRDALEKRFRPLPANPCKPDETPYACPLGLREPFNGGGKQIGYGFEIVALLKSGSNPADCFGGQLNSLTTVENGKTLTNPVVPKFPIGGRYNLPLSVGAYAVDVIASLRDIWDSPPQQDPSPTERVPGWWKSDSNEIDEEEASDPTLSTLPAHGTRRGGVLVLGADAYTTDESNRLTLPDRVRWFDKPGISLSGNASVHEQSTFLAYVGGSDPSKVKTPQEADPSMCWCLFEVETSFDHTRRKEGSAASSGELRPAGETPGHKCELVVE